MYYDPIRDSNLRTLLGTLYNVKKCRTEWSNSIMTVAAMQLRSKTNGQTSFFLTEHPITCHGILLVTTTLSRSP
ncbi:hypothetical protein AQUCO_01500112v1 [Aquilegia coerulea]|uniref:Uncharacterized protein n=1 Tax=Aquilegia coerulea TaxID=218851 RepID=A0A2G5DSY3_AQUCA|nr:hypothetical protein AQUCO_01500112v1 [Aquilegia coerulea]